MGDAKRLIVKPISSQDANRIIKGLHYSGKVVNNSQVHLGVFLDGRCGGAMQFGVSTDIRKTKGLVSGTEWHGFKELNRMAFADWLPPMGESRCIAYAMRWIKRRTLTYNGLFRLLTVRNAATGRYTEQPVLC